MSKNDKHILKIRLGKRGQEISLNVIIVAAIALLVLVIVSIIFIGRMGKTREEVDKCQNNGGTCETTCEGDYVRESTQYRCYYSTGDTIPEGKKAGDINSDLKCCIKI